MSKKNKKKKGNKKKKAIKQEPKQELELFISMTSDDGAFPKWFGLSQTKYLQLPFSKRQIIDVKDYRKIRKDQLFIDEIAKFLENIVDGDIAMFNFSECVSQDNNCFYFLVDILVTEMETCLGDFLVILTGYQKVKPSRYKKTPINSNQGLLQQYHIVCPVWQ